MNCYTCLYNFIYQIFPLDLSRATVTQSTIQSQMKLIYRNYSHYQQLFIIAIHDNEKKAFKGAFNKNEKKDMKKSFLKKMMEEEG